MSEKVKVSEFRRLNDAALNHASYNFNSCVNKKELENWILTANDYLKRLKSILCQRAKKEDVYWHEKAIESLECNIENAKKDIALESREEYTKKLSILAKEKRRSEIENVTRLLQ
jgi:hypothetical protein